MPGGRTHDVVTVVVAPVAFVIGAAWRGWPGGLMFAGAHLFSGLMLSPDLDVGTGSYPYRRWGPFRVVWQPYMRAIGHRSRLSHGPVVGTFLRLAYLGLVAAVAYALFAAAGLFLRGTGVWVDAVEAFGWVSRNRDVVLTAVCGLEFGALCHIVSDKTMRN